MAYTGTATTDIRSLNKDVVGYFLAGNDMGYGDDSDETMYGGIGDDFLIGDRPFTVFNGNGQIRTPFADVVVFGFSSDILHGDGGADALYGGGGNDRLYGGSGDDSGVHGYGTSPHYYYAGLWGGQGDDKLYGGSGKDDLWGEGGKDRLDGGTGNDRLFGADNDDILIGGAGNDLLEGGAGFNTLSGGDGNDILVGGPGFNVLNGGNGADAFRYDKFGDAGDKITAFSSVDQFKFKGTSFGNLPVGVIDPIRFHKNTTGLAHDKDDRFIFDSDDTKLFYDSNGVLAGGNKTMIVDFTGAVVMLYNDITII
jgi:Ca2+-binding RTX toxin-like protein